MESFIDIDTIFINLQEEDRNSLLKKLSSVLYNNGYVNDKYCEAVILREGTYPTALDVEGDIKVAIPHAEPKYVNKSMVAFASLNNPIKFNNMDNPEEAIDVSLVFMLAVKDPSSHVEVLQKLMGVFQDKELLEKLKNCISKEEVKNILEDSIK